MEWRMVAVLRWRCSQRPASSVMMCRPASEKGFQFLHLRKVEEEEEERSSGCNDGGYLFRWYGPVWHRKNSAAIVSL